VRRGPLLVGKISTSGKNISAAKRLVKKTVLCVDNVKNTCSVNDMIAFIKSLSVNVLTCFEVKPRRRASEIDVSDRKAFRICICANDRDRLLNEEAWPDSVSISDWFSKPKQQIVDKKIRLGSSPSVAQSAPTSYDGHMLPSSVQSKVVSMYSGNMDVEPETSPKEIDINNDVTIVMNPKSMLGGIDCSASVNDGGD